MKKMLLLISLTIAGRAWSQTSESVFVHFASDKYSLTAATRNALDSLTDSLDVSDRIELHGHCDARGSDAYNIRLSQQRVKAVEKYLLEIGWEPKDIKIIEAHGERVPLYDNETEITRKLNRRVEIKILRGQSQPTLKQQLGDTKVKPGDNIVLKNIHFEGGKHQFLTSSAKTLMELLEAMQANPKLVIRVEGHICCHEDAGDGFDIETGIENLSEARGEAVRNYLVKNGINANRISYKGFGHSIPLYPYPEKTDEERIANRRVEIKIISK